MEEKFLRRGKGKSTISPYIDGASGNKESNDRCVTGTKGETNKK